MTHCIAFAGKGGTGKTTVAGLFIDYLARAGKGPVLAVDADANSNLNEVLGVSRSLSLGDIREEIAKADADDGVIPAGMSKKEYADFRFGAALVEEDAYDLLVMGRTQGKGCYCFVNDLLREQIRRYYQNYRYLVVDNEAGLEHVSRGILPPVDLILLVSDCSRRGVEAAGRIADLVGQLDLAVKDLRLIVNRAPGGRLDPALAAFIEDRGLRLAGVLPQDDQIYRYDAEGVPLARLPEDNPVRAALGEAIRGLGL